LYSDEKQFQVFSLNGIGSVLPLYNTTKVANGGVIYLGSLNIFAGGITFGGRLAWNSSEIAPVIEDTNVVYANGGSVILKHSP
jgi:hypothetical protein